MEFSNQNEAVLRLKLRKHMVEVLGFPPAHLALEVALSSLPHLKTPLPNRRADLICFAPEIHGDFPLYPLLLVECKFKKVNEEAIRQLLGYNAHVRAFFVACVAGDGWVCGHKDKSSGKYIFYPGLARYETLIERVHEVQLP